MILNLSGLKTFRDRLYVVFPLVGAGVPPLLIMVTVARYGVNVPFWDQWEFVKLLDKAAAGQLEFKDFWEQHNEHRLVLPRMVMLALARATQWDIRYEIAANVVIALLALGMLVLLIERTVRPVAPVIVPWLILAASLTTFSLTQWLNWIWGWQLQIFMNALAAVTTVWALARWRGRWLGLALALLAAIAGALSFATGLILLALIPLALLIGPRFDQGASRLTYVALAAAIGAGVAALYLNGFHHPGQQPSPFFLLSHPVSYGYYVLAYMGSGLGAWSTPVSASWGAMGIATFAWCSAWLWMRSPGLRHNTLLPWILLGLYGILSGFMTGIGRAGYGVEQALGPPYITISSLFWISLVVIAALVIAHRLEDGTASKTRSQAAMVVIVFLLILAGVSYGASWIHAEATLKSFHHAIRRGGECLLDYDKAPDDCLHFLWPDVSTLQERAHRLDVLKLGPFAQSRLERPLSRVNGSGS